MPHLPHQPITSTNPITSMSTLEIEPETQNEIMLLAMLCKAQSEVEVLKKQLAFKEAKKGQKGGKGKLLDNGLPRMLSSDEFYKQVGLWKAAVVEWEKSKTVWKERNAVLMEEYQTAMALWKEAKTQAKKDGKAFRESQPAKPSAKKQARKPLLRDFQGLSPPSTDEDGELFDFTAVSTEDSKDNDKEHDHGQ
ncbi:hypothetical protein P691DRAFT_767660 [Macrolepiota fuliginosa MF-IS2]|uniref:Uncharacterized protein n=1 Tax=Macrolepiota fuliginosa MF-IS2 TaxID=1400762 RepID=A0A9P6BWK1_9AGAR|nr:hypothetical protein P691DRAFT_767660 [Macrolepiota fuliginosa MF-IS2]